MHRVFLLLGSNQGDRINYLSKAREALGTLGTIRSASSIYETEAWGKPDQSAFLNQAIELETDLLPENLLESILGIERALGRERLERYGPRTLDIDILLFDELTVQSQRLTIPHPELHHRRFALTALAAIADRSMHPLLGKTIGELLEECADPLQVKQID